MLNLRLKDRTAIVTGAGRGIGESIALRLAAEGADVLVVGRALDTLASTVTSIEDRGGSARAIVADITQEDDIPRIVEAALERRGRIDVLVNNAAMFDEPPFLELTPRTIRANFETNVFGLLLLSQAVARSMVEQPSGGSIVHISSIGALAADGPFTAYMGTKGAVVSMTRGMAMELSPLGVRVNCVAPGFVNTDMTHKTSTPAVLDYMLNNFERVPIRRLIEPEEIAAAVAFLASDDALAITGTNLLVDGGITSSLHVMETLPDEMIALHPDA
ncbi:SDR family NAD(P)-dependent oxidoreductase [Leucobacter japonicus]|uniref:SDR family NAD(P)-dependent oxidoreductase n=1 Tax=Leucobacter japonicus TaxID=1461259 RepID=UPI0006A7E18B|nr:SDR family oxidoreductase [Leucobacter japonicus]